MLIQDITHMSSSHVPEQESGPIGLALTSSPSSSIASMCMYEYIDPYTNQPTGEVCSITGDHSHCESPECEGRLECETCYTCHGCCFPSCESEQDLQSCGYMFSDGSMCSYMKGQYDRHSHCTNDDCDGCLLCELCIQCPRCDQCRCY